MTTPTVYNGRSAREWYTLYCHEAVRLYRLIEAAKDVIELECSRLNKNGDGPYDPIADPDQFDSRVTRLAQLLYRQDASASSSSSSPSSALGVD